MTGLTRIPAQMIYAPGNATQTEIVVTGERLVVTDPLESDVSEIAGGFYDRQQGELTLTMYNGTAIKISGFPASGNIPAGPTGPQGLQGKDGRDGRDGKDGAQGEPGCEGPPGPQGATGNTGPDGRDGRMGEQGVRGCPGPKGPPGERGATGPEGPVGPTGPQGKQGAKGVPGTAGADSKVNIIVSTTDPGAVGAGWLWVNPSATAPVTGTAPSTGGGGGGGSTVTDPPIGTPWP